MHIIKEILLSLHSNLPDSRSSNGNYVACSRSRTVPLPEAFKAKGAVFIRTGSCDDTYRQQP